MSIGLLLHSSDAEFEASIGQLTDQEVIGIMHEIIQEMDKEQTRFDSLSARLDLIKDQASADFKEVSSELVKSQNTLTLLMSRNMFCFNLQNEMQNSTKPSKDIVISDTKPTSTGDGRRKSSLGTTTKRKVVKVTRVVTRKKIPDNEDHIDPELKSIMESRRTSIKNYINPPQTESTENGDPKRSVRETLAKPTINGHSRKSSINSTGGAAPVTNIDEVSKEEVLQALPTKNSVAEDNAAVSDTDTASSSETAIDLAFDFNANDFEAEKVKERVFLKSWNPVKILNELYALRLAKETSSIRTEDIINIQGYLEQLPVGKAKSTLLKTWKRTYCVAKDGVIYLYRSQNKESESSAYFSIMGGTLEELPNRMIGIDDKRGHYLMVRCPSDADHCDWLRSLHTQIRCSAAVSYIRPALSSAPHPSKVLIADLGSCSVRAGLLGTTPSYPQIFIPCVASKDKTGKVVFGKECYEPDVRVNGLQFPVATNRKVDKYRVNVTALQELFTDVFEQLGVVSSDYTVMLATPHNFSSRLKEELLKILFGKLHVVAVNMVNQCLLTPYIYNATTGLVVDIGQRVELAALTDGYLVEGGLRIPYGGNHITDTLNSCLMEYRLYTPAEHLITRLIKEKTCFISQDYDDDLLECMGDNSRCQATIDLEQFDLPEGAHLKLITVDSARFKAAEGLIKSELLGLDSPTLPQLIQRTIAKCPMDSRREMWQSIYLSGGTTLLEGFPERLETELVKIAPSSVTVKVHASAHRYHAAYIGAGMLATLPNFRQSCITKEEWSSHGRAALNKWKQYFQSA